MPAGSPTAWVDMRSDTVTEPTPAMRQAMATAAVGDDVYGDDPTVWQLEQAAARRLGKDAALFVPTGTFGNQLALFTHCRRGDEVILGDDAHIVWHENGAAAVIAGVQLRTLASDRGVLDPAAIESRLRTAPDLHAPATGLICLENAHGNGRVIPLETLRQTHALARRHGVPVHLDGARVFNAATHLGCDVAEIAACADSVMCCLSKGLAAPVGSILAGSAAFIDRARYKRKLMGGGWRQAGVLAAPGLLALTEMSQRLGADHANARHLAARLAALPGIEIEPADVHINIVWFGCPPHVTAERLVDALAAAGIRANGPYGGRMRLVTHWQVDRAAVDRAADAIRQCLEAATP